VYLSAMKILSENPTSRRRQGNWGHVLSDERNKELTMPIKKERRRHALTISKGKTRVTNGLSPMPRITPDIPYLLFWSAIGLIVSSISPTHLNSVFVH